MLMLKYWLPLNKGIDKTLNKLTDKYRIMIELRFFEELSYQVV